MSEITNKRKWKVNWSQSSSLVTKSTESVLPKPKGLLISADDVIISFKYFNIIIYLLVIFLTQIASIYLKDID